MAAGTRRLVALRPLSAAGESPEPPLSGFLRYPLPTTLLQTVRGLFLNEPSDFGTLSTDEKSPDTEVRLSEAVLDSHGIFMPGRKRGFLRSCTRCSIKRRFAVAWQQYQILTHGCCQYCPLCADQASAQDGAVTSATLWRCPARCSSASTRNGEPESFSGGRTEY